jgi:hypothetical protein
MQVQGVVPEAYYWVCRSCYNKRITRCAFSVGYGTAPGTKHLSTHNITVHGEGEAKRSRLSSSFAASSTNSSSHGQDIERCGTVFHPAAWKARVVALICHDNHAFQLFESPYLQDLCSRLIHQLASEVVLQHIRHLLAGSRKYITATWALLLRS